MVVQHNMQAANANRMLGLTVNSQQKSTEKLSSGYRINRAADDAAGLAISEKMRSQIRGLDRASTNAQDGISVVQTAEGALNEVHSMLQRMNELATQAANDTNTSNDRAEIQLEVDQLTSEINRVASTTQFNTMNLLDGSFTGKNLQVGSLSGQTIELSIGSMNAEALGLEGTKAADTYTDTVETVHGAVSFELGTAGLTTDTATTFNPADMFDSASAAKLTTTGTTYVYDGNNSWHQDGHPGNAITLNFKDATHNAAVGAKFTTNGTTATGETTTVSGFKKAGTLAQAGDYTITEDNLNKAKADTYVYANGKWTGKNTGEELTVGMTAANKVIGDGASVTIGEATKGHKKGDVKPGSTTDAKLNVTTHDGAEAAMTSVQNAIDKVSSQRATLGAVQNRLEHTIANLDTTSENTQAAESRIRDTDMAKEMVTWSKNNILAQAGQSMLAQANQSNQGVLSLLQ